jgi:DNA-binding transcriptional LysR family regulator
VIGEIERAEEDVRRLAGHTDGIIRVTTQCNTGYHWLAPLLAVYQRRHPRVSVNIAADATDKPVEALLDGRVDLAILIDPRADPRLHLRPLFADEMAAIVARTHPLARRRWVGAEDLAAEHLLLYSSRPEESFLLRRVLGPAGLKPARVSFIMLTEAMIELARAGTGVGILPRWSAQRAIAGGASRRCPSPAAACGASGWRPLAAHATPAYLDVFSISSPNARCPHAVGRRPARPRDLWLPASAGRLGCRQFGHITQFRLKPEAQEVGCHV